MHKGNAKESQSVLLFGEGFAGDKEKFGYAVHQHQGEDDGGAGRDIVHIGEDQSGDGAHEPKEDGEEDHLVEIAGEEVGDGLRNGEQRHHQDNSHYPDIEHNGKRHQTDKDHVEKPDRGIVCKGILFVEGDKKDHPVEEDKKGANSQRKEGQEQNIGERDREDVPEEVTHQVGGISGSQENKDDAKGHSQGPQHGNGRVLPEIGLPGKEFDPKGGEYSKQNGSQNRIKSHVIAHADSSE